MSIINKNKISAINMRILLTIVICNSHLAWSDAHLVNVRG